MTVNGRAYEGVGFFKFALTGPADQTFWSNDGSALGGGEPSQAVSLQMRRGIYSVRLGDGGLTNMVAIPLSVFTNDTLRVCVWFSDGTNGFQQLIPDGKIGSVAFAIRAESARTVETLPDGLIEQRHLSTNLVGRLGADLVSSNNVWTGQNRLPDR